MVRLVVALGNPGVKYEFTRHNIGWLVVDYLDQKLGLRWKDKFKGEYADIVIADGQTFFLKPHTFMNLSGESVSKLLSFYKVDILDVIALHDDIELPFGTIAFKKGGGLAGHNGLRSMNQQLGNADFYRLRLGVGRPERGSVSSWVLSSFSKDEESTIEQYTQRAGEALLEFLENGFTSVDKKYKKANLLAVE